MEEPAFEWDAANRGHIARHAVIPAEVEEAFADPDRTPFHAAFPPGERWWAVLGRTAAGRLLQVIYTVRAGRIRVVTAFTASSQVARFYRGPQWDGDEDEGKS